MVGVLIVSHGSLAEAFIASVQSLVGKMEKIKGISIWPKDNPKEISDQILKNVKEVDDGHGVLILTDMLGGTPTQTSLSSLEKGRVAVVTGVNIPMLLTVSSYRKGRSLKEIGKLVKRSGRRSIILVKPFLKAKEKRERAKLSLGNSR